MAETGENTEIRGLATIIAGMMGTLGGIEAPPEPADYATDAEYQRAHDDWWVRVHCWRVERVDLA